MADKAISELTEAITINNADAFVLEQSGTAKKLMGSTLISKLAEALEIAVGTITLSTTWSGNDPYSQVVTSQISGVTAKSVIELQPTIAQISALETDGVKALVVENNAGVITVHASGGTNSSAMTIQYTRQESA